MSVCVSECVCMCVRVCVCVHMSHANHGGWRPTYISGSDFLNQLTGLVLSSKCLCNSYKSIQQCKHSLCVALVEKHIVTWSQSSLVARALLKGLLSPVGTTCTCTSFALPRGPNRNPVLCSGPVLQGQA